MSCYLIEYRDGAKVMSPVTTREKYLQLRGLAVHKDRVERIRSLTPSPSPEGEGSMEEIQALKRRLIQFNYSCIPDRPSPDSPLKGEGVDTQAGCGLLKGCKQMSTSVGIDVDHIPPEEMEATKERILAKKDEIGLLMLERSVRCEGYHLVCKRLANLSQEDNIKHIAEILEVEPDMGAKDITRVFFATTASPEDLIYLDDELFKNEACEEEVKSEQLKVNSERVASPQSSPKGKEDGNAEGYKSLPSGRCEGNQLIVDSKQQGEVLCETSSETKLNQQRTTVAQQSCGAWKGALKAFDLCCKQADLDPEKMDIWGEHNWHSNLMAVLSVGLPKLMSKEQLMAVVREKLPNYSQYSDCKALIDFFYEKYSADKGYMTTSLRQINAEAQRDALAPDDEQDDKDLKELARGWEPPKVPKKIPRLMTLLAGNYDPRFQQMLYLSALPVLSAHASHFRAVYLNGCEIGPQQYVAVIGGSGKGKGNATKLFNEMVEHTLKDHDENEWGKLRVNTEMRDQETNAKKRPPKYHPKIRLFETTSKSSILELQTNLGNGGMLLGQFSEVDGLSSATRSSFSDISVLLRKGWDMDWHRQFYMSDATCNTYCQMSISLLMAGTVKAMLERMFSDSNCEGGLMQRFITVLLPNTKRTFRPPKMNYLSEDEKRERDALLLELYQKDLSLGDSTCLLETPMTNKAIGEWFDSLEERYNDGLLSDAEADLSHRCGEFMLRAAIPLIALYGKETKEIVDFARWVGETAHYTMCHIFGHRVQKDINDSNEMLAERFDARKTAEPLLDSLPEVFSVSEFKEARVKAGQSPEARMLLTRYCKNGRLERVGRGVYRKCIIISDTKIGDHTPE